MLRIGARSFLFLAAWVFVMSVQAATPHVPASSDADYRAIVAQAAETVERTLGKPAALDVRQLQTLEGWAFLRAQINSPGGQPIDYGGTPYADSQQNGSISKTYVALLQKQGDAWRIAVDRIGPTDVIWETWSKDYGAPAALFDTP